MTRFRSGFGWLAALLLLGLLVDHGPASSQAPPRGPVGVTVPTAGGSVSVLADRLEEVGHDKLLVATGNVEITRGTTRLTADRVEVNRETGAAVATGHVIFYDGEDRVTGERIDYNVTTGTGVVHHGSAHAAPYYRIAGERMERIDANRYVVRRGVFTTCEEDPPAWSFRFGSADADLEEYLYGTDASFWVKNVPLIPFIPVFAAAIRRERQTGFLFPRFGSSSRKGAIAEIPFFWAISESQDATITFDAYTERGYGGNLEYRYNLSEQQRGNLRGFFLHESERQGDTRGWWSLKHDWLIGSGTTLRADINGVGDDVVLREYGDRLSERGAQRVESNVFLTRSWTAWNLVGNMFWYQDLTAGRSVELNRLPDIRLQGVRQPLPGVSGALYDVEASAVKFVRDVGSDGIRVDVHPRLARPVSVFDIFTVTPFAGARLTTYDKRVTGTRTTRADAIAVEVTEEDFGVRRLGELGTDLESRVVRVFPLEGRGGIDAVLHSIEPRVNYTWADGPELLRRTARGGARLNRFPQWDSIDSIAETSTFTYSLTNRLHARTVAPAGTEPVRWELIRLALGHSYDLLAPERPLGDVTGDLIVAPNRSVSFRADASYGVYGDGLKSVNTDLAVRAPRLTASLGSRLVREPETADPGGSRQSRVTTSFLQGNVAGDITRNLAGRFTTNWDTRTNTVVENRFGVDVKWQCWAFTLEYVTRHRDESALHFTLNLLGLGAPLTTGTRLGALGDGAARAEVAR